MSTPNSQLCITLSPLRLKAARLRCRNPGNYNSHQAQEHSAGTHKKQDTAEAAGSRSPASPTSRSQRCSASASSPQELPLPSLLSSYVPGLTFRSSTDTSSFSTASMATAPASLTLRSLLGHGLHGPVAGTERHFRQRPVEAPPLPPMPGAGGGASGYAGFLCLWPPLVP